MRFGCNWRSFESIEDVDEASEYLSTYEIGTIAGPPGLASWSVEEARSYGKAVRNRGLTIGEIGYWENLLTPDEATRADRIETLRSLLVRADAMRVDCVVSLVGSMSDGWAGEPHPDNYGELARERTLETIDRVLDGLTLDRTTWALEPWFNTFFHQPTPVATLLEQVDDPRLGVHMDAMNMLCVETVHRSTETIGEMFELLADRVVSVHAKDIRMDDSEFVVALRECPPGEGAMDFDRYLTELDALDEDLPVFTEHWEDSATFERSIRFLQDRAEALGATVVTP